MIADRKIATSDLDEILEHAGEDIRHFAGKAICIPGGTGFVGKWLVASIEHANEKLGTDIEVCAFGRNIPPDFEAPYDAIIMAAPIHPGPWLGLARQWDDCPLLYLSSGAVYYDNHRPEVAGEKRAGEAACATYPNAKIARLFSFIGPYLGPQYAASQFIADAVADRPIKITGSGDDVRSWLYPTDMVILLWAIFARAISNVPCDVGAKEPYTTWALAHKIARQVGAGVTCNFLTAEEKGKTTYLPTSPFLDEHVEIHEAIRRTLAFDAH